MLATKGTFQPVDPNLHPPEVKVGDLKQTDFRSPEAVAVSGQEQGIVAVALLLDKQKQPAQLVGRKKFYFLDAGSGGAVAAAGQGVVAIRLPPAHQLEHRDDDVAGAAGQATDEPVALFLLGRAGKLPAAMGAIIGHRVLGKITLLPNTLQEKGRFVEGLLSTAGGRFLTVMPNSQGCDKEAKQPETLAPAFMGTFTPRNGLYGTYPVWVGKLITADDDILGVILFLTIGSLEHPLLSKGLEDAKCPTRSALVRRKRRC